MSYTDDFNNIINSKDYIENYNMIIFPNTNPSELKIFPEQIRKPVLMCYFEFLQETMTENEFVNFIPNQQENNTLQVISTEKLKLWADIKSAIDNMSITNREAITVDDYNCNGNTILMDIEFKDSSHVYFLTRYIKSSAWYSNKLLFVKKENGKFHEEQGNIFVLTPIVDAVIKDDLCYIINEKNFSQIFKFDEVIVNQIKEHEQEIRNMNFIDNADIFMNFLNESKRPRNAMAKVIMQNRLEKIKQFDAEYIRTQIENQQELSFIEYTDNNKIIINDKKSFNVVVDILCGKINLDLITKELNGIDEYE